MKIAVPCNICSSTKSTVVREGQKKEELSEVYTAYCNTPASGRLVKCDNCGLIYVNPRFSDDVILKACSSGRDERYVSQAKGREMTFNRDLDVIEKYVSKGRLLDVGTAGGSFLHVAKQRGWDVYGIEPNRWLCEWGRKKYGIEIEEGTIFDLKYEEGYFDLITLWDVLEHTTDPKKTLERCSSLLKQGGILVVNYPDIGSIVSKLMGSRWFFLLDVHIYYFTRETVGKMLYLTGFETVKYKPHVQILSLGYLVSWMEPRNRTLYKLARTVIHTLRLDDLQVPYWLGQTLVIAKKSNQ